MRCIEGQRWLCSNVNCRCELVVTASAAIEGRGNPRCCCGAAMKQAYEAPAARRVTDAAKREEIKRLLSEKER
jgi:hypothetical protein